MKKNELKSLLKPLIKECVNEVLLEEGVLSNVVSEVVAGMQGSVVTEVSRPQRAPVSQPAVNTKKLREQREKLMSAIGADAYNGVDLFEDTTPMAGPQSSQASAGSVDLGSASDAGVDISSLVGNASQIWQAIK